MALYLSVFLSPVFSSPNDRVKPYETRSVCTDRAKGGHIDEGRGRATGGTYVVTRVHRRTGAHTYAHVHMGLRCAAPSCRRRAPPPRAQSHVGGRPPSVLKYPGPGEPSSRAAMPLLSTTTIRCARDSLLPYSLYSLFLFLSLPSSLSLAPTLPPTVRAPLSFSRSLCAHIFPGSCAADLAALFLPDYSRARSRVSSLRRSRFAPSVRARAYPLSGVPFRSLLSPIIPRRPLRPLHLLGRSLRHEIRLPSERNQSPCTKRCATPRVMRKLESA